MLKWWGSGEVENPGRVFLKLKVVETSSFHYLNNSFWPCSDCFFPRANWEVVVICWNLTPCHGNTEGISIFLSKRLGASGSPPPQTSWWCATSINQAPCNYNWTNHPCINATYSVYIMKMFWVLLCNAFRFRALNNFMVRLIMYFIICESLGFSENIVKCCQGCVFKLQLQINTLRTELSSQLFYSLSIMVFF